MKRVRDIIDRQIIDDLWGAGYTILPRNRHVDPFFVPPEIIPQGRAYQWMHLVHDKFHYGHGGWAAVSASRHDGYFMPAGFVGDIEVNGLGLFEKPKFEVEQERTMSAAAAHKAVDDWGGKWGSQFSGETVVSGERTEIGETKTIEDTTKIPRDMVPYIAQIFEERDALYNSLVSRWNAGLALTAWESAIKTAYEVQLSLNKDSPLGPTLNRLILPTAIENIRKQFSKEATHGDDHAA